MTAENFTALLRHLLTFAGGFIASSGYATTDEINLAIGAVVTLVGTGWSIWAKRKPAA
jgi:hypothetical protein